MTGLKAGTDYKVSVIVKADGKWNEDFSNAITVTPKSSTTPAPYPEITSIDYSEKYHQIKFNYITPKNMTPGKTYKVAIAAKVNGTWGVAEAIKNAVTVTVK